MNLSTDHDSALTLPCAGGDVEEFLSAPWPKVSESLTRSSGDYMVLGAGGKMGLHLSRMLRRGLDEAGAPGRVLAVSRFGSPAIKKDFEEAGIEPVSCDLSEPAEVAKLMPVENVFFMAGAKFGTADRPDILHKMNIEMPRLVAEHFRESRITTFSTGCVYSYVPIDSSGSTEISPTEPVGDYAQSCLGREQAFQDASLRHGTKVVLIRLNYSVEFRYGVLVDIAAKVLRGEPVDLSVGHVNVIWQRDAVGHTILAQALAGSPAVPLNVTGPGVHRVRDLAGRFGKVFGRTPIFTGEEASEIWLNDASMPQESSTTVNTPSLLGNSKASTTRSRRSNAKPMDFATKLSSSLNSIAFMNLRPSSQGSKHELYGRQYGSRVESPLPISHYRPTRKLSGGPLPSSEFATP